MSYLKIIHNLNFSFWKIQNDTLLNMQLNYAIFKLTANTTFVFKNTQLYAFLIQEFQL